MISRIYFVCQIHPFPSQLCTIINAKTLTVINVENEVVTMNVFFVVVVGFYLN